MNFEGMMKDDLPFDLYYDRLFLDLPSAFYLLSVMYFPHFLAAHHLLTMRPVSFSSPF